MYYSIVNEYITRADDTIYKIAIRFYFKWNLWTIIYDYNREALGADPYNIPAGVEIKIVGINTEQVSHTINDGDTYHSLSRDYYGTERHYFDIGRVNDYKHLVPGETAIIPALITSKDLDNARRIVNVCS